MAIGNNVRLLLFICCNAAISFHLATSQLSPETSPSPQPDISSPPTLSPSPGPGPTLSPSAGPAPGPAPISHVSYPPSISESISPTAEGPSESISPTTEGPSESISPTAEGPTAFNYLLDFDISPTPSSFDVNPQVKEICESADYPSLCLATVAPHLNGKADIPAVLQVSVKAGISIARHALSVAKEIDENTEDPELAAILHDCKNIYGDVVYSYENALRAFPERDIGTMNSMFSLVITDIGDCEDALHGVGAQSPLSDYADKLTNITNNCLAIASLMN